MQLNNAVCLILCALSAPLPPKFILKISDAGISGFAGTLLKLRRPRAFSDFIGIQRNDAGKRNRHERYD